MLIFPSTGRTTIPDNIEQWKGYSEQRKGVQCLSDMSVRCSAGPSARGSGGSGTSPHYSHFSHSTKSSLVSVPLHRLFLSPGAFPPQLTLLILTDSSSPSLDFYFPWSFFNPDKTLHLSSMLPLSQYLLYLICILLRFPTPHSPCEILQGSRSCYPQTFTWKMNLLLVRYWSRYLYHLGT